MKDQKRKVLIIGAGAIGRGFAAIIFHGAGFSVYFVEKDLVIIESLKARKAYITAITGSSSYHFTKVEYYNVYQKVEESNISEYDFVVMSVGPQNCLDLASNLRKARTVFVLENDINIVKNIKELSQNENVFFGIPDVITSNTAPPELLSMDPLCVVSEQGKLILERGKYALPVNEFLFQVEKDELYRHWNCKFYIHNAPHAIVAYLGALKNYSFIHEAMADDSIGNIVKNAMESVCHAIIRENIVPERIATEYKNNELMRFQNQLLFDPITRVARDPMRKLSRNNRLIKALFIVLKTGFDPSPFFKGINAALKYRGETLDDKRFDRYRKRISPSYILKNLCGINNNKVIRLILEAD